MLSTDDHVEIESKAKYPTLQCKARKETDKIEEGSA
jgi:hypothetical protein